MERSSGFKLFCTAGDAVRNDGLQRVCRQMPEMTQRLRETRGMTDKPKNRELVSVIVPVYNIEDYLEKCLDSIAGQTYTQLEVYLIDDGSTDGSGQICDRYAEKDLRFRVIHQENGGSSCARNTGLDRITGDYLYFVDGDDWLDTDIIEDLMNEMEGYDVCACGISTVVEGTVLRNPRTRKEYDGKSAVKEAYNGDEITIPVWNKLYRADLFEEFRFPEGRKNEDHFVTPRILYGCRRVLAVERFGYNYLNTRVGSICNTTDRKFCTDIVEIQISNALWFEEKDEPELARMFWEKTLRYWLFYYSDSLKRKDREALSDSRELYQKIKNNYRRQINGTLKLKMINLALTVWPDGLALLRLFKHRKAHGAGL